MTTPSNKLATSLSALESLQTDGVVAIRSAQLSRTHRQRLQQAGFLKEVMKGWYIASRPGEVIGESTAWYTAFWDFITQYLTFRFADAWSLSPEQSLLLHSGNRTIPRQLLVRAPNGRNRATAFPHETSIFETRAKVATGEDLTVVYGLRLFTIDAALIQASESFFKTHPTDARALLAAQADASKLLAKLLEGGHTRAAGRLAGAFRNIGKDRIADEIVSTMKAALYDVRETNPFDDALPVIGMVRARSPHANRIKIMWDAMREDIAGQPYLKAQPQPNDIDAYVEAIDTLYITDAYHSLSIEGYQVSRELIDRVRTGAWNPDANDQDHDHRNALAARGYWQAFQAVKGTIRNVLEGKNPGNAVEDDLSR